MNKEKVLVLASLVSFSTIAAPTFYGKMNFEARYIDQDVNDRKAEVLGAATKNLPPRLGMYGFVKPDNLDASLMYFGEMGYHTWSNSGAGEIKLRLAGVSLESTTYGKLTIGRHYPVTELVGTEIDPLVNTGASGQGLDQYYDIQGARTFNGVGYYGRYFQDAISYKTPVFKGLQLALSVDNNSHQENNDKALVKDAYPVATYYSALLTYDFELSAVKSKVYGGYVKGVGTVYALTQPVSSAVPFTAMDRDDRMLLAFKTSYMNWNIGGYYSHQELRTLANHDVSAKNCLTFLTAFYNGERHMLGLTFSEAVYNDDGKGSEESKQTQYALGYQYHLTKGADLTATLARFDIKDGNRAQSVILGTAINF